MNRREQYLAGYRHGRALADHQPNINHEPALRQDLKHTGQRFRARVLGELRGYRQARHD